MTKFETEYYELVKKVNAIQNAGSCDLVKKDFDTKINEIEKKKKKKILIMIMVNVLLLKNLIS